jgi:hypothetical protein
MDRYWLEHYLNQLFGYPTRTTDLNKYYSDMMKRMLEYHMNNQHYIGSLNPFDIVDEVSEMLGEHIDDMEDNAQMEADMTITRNGKTYLVSIKSIPSLKMDDEDNQDSEESDEEEE